MNINVAILDDRAVIPENIYEGDAAVDLRCLEDFNICRNEVMTISTGLAFEIPYGYAGFVQPRSGLAAKNGITVLNTPGLIDSGYRGEIKVILHKVDAIVHTDSVYSGLHDYTTNFKAGDRIAQLVIQKIEHPNFVYKETLSETERSDGGLGSSGK